MKAIYILASLCLLTMASKAQQSKDSVAIKSNKDTIRIGSILIIRNNKSKSKTDSTKNDDITITTGGNSIKRKKKISTNYIIVDAGFANWTDNTNYTPTPSGIINRPGTAAFGASDMKLRSGKSANVNIWFFMQKVSLYKNNFNLKYGLGFDFNNYSFRAPVSFRESGILPNGTGASTVTPFIFRDSISFSKNKLNLKYLTIPVMLNVATTKKKGMPKLSASLGMSAGYLIRERNKQNSSERGRQKNQGDYDLQKFKISYIGELGLGPVRLYGSYSPKSIFEKGLDVRPYAVGIRFSNW